MWSLSIGTEAAMEFGSLPSDRAALFRIALLASQKRTELEKVLQK